MDVELQKLIENSKHPEGLARLFEHVADRLDEMRLEMFSDRAAKEEVEKNGGADGRR